MSDTDRANINLNCLYIPINGFDGLPYHLRIIPISAVSTADMLRRQIQAVMPNGLTHINYRVRIFRPGLVVYGSLPAGGMNIGSYFAGNLDHNIIHIIVEPLSEPEENN